MKTIAKTARFRRSAAAMLTLLTLFGGSSSALAHGTHPRSRALHVTKECSQYTGAAGDFCTITSSNVPLIRDGMKVVYLSAVDPATATLDTDVVLSSKRGSTAHGHVTLDLTTLTGTVTFDGGTGKFRSFHAIANVTCSDPIHCAWVGTYTLGGHDDD